MGERREFLLHEDSQAIHQILLPLCILLQHSLREEEFIDEEEHGGAMEGGAHDGKHQRRTFAIQIQSYIDMTSWRFNPLAAVAPGRHEHHIAWDGMEKLLVTFDMEVPAFQKIDVDMVCLADAATDNSPAGGRIHSAQGAATDFAKAKTECRGINDIRMEICGNAVEIRVVGGEEFWLERLWHGVKMTEKGML